MRTEESGTKMNTSRPISAKRWLATLVLLGATGVAWADSYTVVLKVNEVPCLSYTAEIDATTPGTQSTTLGAPTSLNAECDAAQFPAEVPVNASILAFPDVDPGTGGRSRVDSIDGSAAGGSAPGGTLTISAGGNSVGNWTLDRPNPTQDRSGTYFIYNTAGSVPTPAAFPLLLLGGAGMLVAARLRRRKRK